MAQKQSNIATGRGGVSRGAERDHLSARPAPHGRSAGWRERGVEWLRSRRNIQPSRLVPVGVDGRLNRIAQVGPADGGMKLRRVRELGALGAKAGRLGGVRDRGLHQTQFFHHRIPSVAVALVNRPVNGRTEIPKGSVSQ